jgi:hypothetical protein
LEKQIIEAQGNEKKAQEEGKVTVEAVKRKAKEDVEVAKSEYEERAASLSQREKRVSNCEILVSARESDIDGEVAIKAEQMIRN